MVVDEDGRTRPGAPLRTRLRRSGDPRVARTRASLFAAVHALHAADREVTVSAVTCAAGVSRSVFYTHFADLADLAVRMIEPHLAEIAAQATAERRIEPHRAMLDAQRRLVGFLAENRGLYAAVLNGGTTRAVVTAELTRAIREPLTRHLAAIGGAPSPLRSDLTATYVAAAATGVLTDWLSGGLDADAEAVAQHLFALMPAWLHAGAPVPSSSTADREESP